MAIDMNLVRADPALQLSPHLMEEAEKNNLDLATYTFLLLKDLASGPTPFKRALSLVDEGNIALARRYISAYTLDEKETAEFERHCAQVERTTNALALQVDRQMTQLGKRLDPSTLSKCQSLREACRAAARQGRYHIAQRELATLQYLLLDMEKSAPALPAERPGERAQTPPPVTLHPIEARPAEAARVADLMDDAVTAWEDTIAQFSSPLKAWLRPDDSTKISSYIGVRQLLQQSQHVEEGWRQTCQEALRQYFYLGTEDRQQLKGLFAQSLAIYALECLKESISYKDFDTASLIHTDILRLIEVDTQVAHSDQVVYDSHRYGIEVHAALFAQDTTRSFEQFDASLFEQTRRHLRRLNPEKIKKILDYGKVVFFYYRIHAYKEHYQELVQFYTQHYAAIDNLARGDIELNRFLEMARVKYNDALYHKTESELTDLSLPAKIAFEDTLQFIQDLAPYQVVSGLKSIRQKFADKPEAAATTLMHLYELVLMLFDMQKPEELVFAHKRITELTNITASSEGKRVQASPASETMPLGVLSALESMVNHAVAAVSKTDLASVRQHIAYALEEIRGQRKYLQDAGPALRHLWHMLGDHWISILVSMQRAISRQTSLSLSLQSEEIIADEESSLVVYVKNNGPAIARQIELALISPDLGIKPGILRCPLLVAGDESSLSFTVKPRAAGERFEVRLLVRYLDPDDRSIISSEERAIAAKKIGDNLLPRRSPYVWGQPLDKDSEVFVGREDVFEFLRTRFWGEERNKIIALQGERRMGKTSVLYQLGKRKIFGNYRIVMFDFQGRYANIDSMHEFLFNFARRVRSEARLPAELQIDKADFLVSARAYYDVFEQWLDRAEEELERRDTQVVVLFDEFEKLLGRRFDDSVNANPRMVEELLQYLRSIMLARKRFNWIITGSWSLIARQRDYFSSLFGMALSYWVNHLKREDAIALIQAPLKNHLVYDQDAVERILRLTGGHPFYIQMICDALFNRARSLNARRIQVGDVNWVTHDTLQQVTESSFRTNWVSLSGSMARMALAAVAESMQEPHDYVLKKSVLSFLHRTSPRLDEDAFYGVVDVDSGELVRRELVELHPSDAERLRIRSELFYHWLRKSKSLAAVLREER